MTRRSGTWFVLAVILITCLAGCNTTSDDPGVGQLKSAMEKLRALHQPLGEPGPNDWLTHHKESGQTFEHYLNSTPVKPDEQRRTIVIQPLGEFTESQRKIVDLTAEFMGLYFNLPVRVVEPLGLDIIPEEARRVHPSWGMKQILSTYVLDDVLKPRLPDDAVVYIAFTPSDLWPGKGWNFVFGQASLRERVGVWSLYRNGDPDESEETFRLCLLRTMKTGTHETGHMFGMQHCILYECNMCGSNHREESDRRPLACCPECLAKVCWVTNADPAERFEKLAAFCERVGLEDEASFYRESLKALE